MVDFPLIFYRLLRKPTSLINVAVKGLDSDYAKDGEEKHHEYQGISQFWKRPKHDGNKSSHTWHSFDRSQRSDNPESPQHFQRWQTVRILKQNQLQNAKYNHREINNVPAIS